jgi:hypothetical protein
MRKAAPRQVATTTENTTGRAKMILQDTSAEATEARKNDAIGPRNLGLPRRRPGLAQGVPCGDQNLEGGKLDFLVKIEYGAN